MSVSKSHVPKAAGGMDHNGVADAGSVLERTGACDLPITFQVVIQHVSRGGKAAALVEFKNEKAKPIHMGHPSIRALIGLADAANIPLFLVRYASDFSWYFVTPGNAKASEFIPEPCELSELEWIQLLYRCRGRNMPDKLASRFV